MPINYKWTFILMIQALDDDPRNKNFEYMKTMIGDLLNLTKHTDLGVVICLHTKSNLPSSVFPRSNNPVTGPTTNLFYTLENKSVEDSGSKLVLMNNGEREQFNICDEIAVRDFFIHDVIRYAPADQYVLFTWGHGQPCGIFKPISGQIEDALTIRRIKAAISAPGSLQKVDVMVMNNCFLQFFDTGYELRSCVDHLVAYETEMFFNASLDPVAMISYINNRIDNVANTPILSRELAGSVIEELKNRPLGPVESKNRENTSAFATSLRTYGDMGVSLMGLASELISRLDSTVYKAKVRSAVGNCTYISVDHPEYCLLDVADFIEKLNKQSPDAPIPISLYNAIKIQLSDLVIESHRGRLITAPASSTSHVINASAFSIYFPGKRGLDSTRFYLFFMRKDSLNSCTSFIRESRWTELTLKMEQVFPSNPFMEILDKFVSLFR
ncbi:MAG: clostripain-related cysteine peptidase [Bacteroidota bacterium]